MKTNRRSFFQTLGAGTAGVGIASALPLTSCVREPESPAEDDGQILFIGDDIALADTEYGKVKGFLLRGITQFRGIPYGADTGGKNRFLPPQPPKPWDDVFPAVWWGNTAPQIMDNRYANAYASFADHWNYDDVSEDCLRLNVWTPAVDQGKRPVLVWLHGGGFTNGSGIEQDGYMGENLSRKGDVVFVSLNHRIGPIGFTDLSAVGGEKYKDSGNVGVLDIQAALDWVHRNIANFGGDPGNVTIMGQSGGGAKVCTVSSMPASAGKVHKAVALSGNIIGAVPKNYSEKLGRYIVKEAGLKASEVDKLQEIPWKEYILLANRAAEALIRDEGPSGMMRGSFGPVGDGVHVPDAPFFSDPGSYSAQIPMILSTTTGEFSPSRTNAALEELSLDQVKEQLAGYQPYGADLQGKDMGQIVDAYAEAFPERTPTDIWSMILSNRTLVVETANAKVAQSAPVYLAWFDWQPPLFDKRMRAFHCLDICFWFNNTDLMLTHTGGGARPRKLAGSMSDALLQFMRNGDPNTPSLPVWPTYTLETGEVMMLNDESTVKNDPDREARRMLKNV
ncbi:MAG: carboxylesterase family protein [Bacteroidales bacterium]